MITLNYTSFASRGLQVTAAMRHVLMTGEAARLTNRKGDHWLLIVLERHGERGYAFNFYDVNGNEVGNTVLKASIKCWSDLHHQEFWRMHGEAWELPEHPLITIAKREREETLKRMKDGHIASTMVKAGATHKLHTWGGVVHWGKYVRNWYGKKVLVLVGDKHGKVFAQPVKVNPEVLPTIRHVERIA